jgi:hypothetical protein
MACHFIVGVWAFDALLFPGLGALEWSVSPPPRWAEAIVSLFIGTGTAFVVTMGICVIEPFLRDFNVGLGVFSWFPKWKLLEELDPESRGFFLLFPKLGLLATGFYVVEKFLPAGLRGKWYYMVLLIGRACRFCSVTPCILNIIVPLMVWSRFPRLFGNRGNTISISIFFITVIVQAMWYIWRFDSTSTYKAGWSDVLG